MRKKFLKPIICFDCEMRLGEEATKASVPFDIKRYKKEYIRIRREQYNEKRFCKHFTLEHWKNLGFEDAWSDAAVRNFPYLTILRWQDKTDTKFVILAPAITRRPIFIHAKDPNAYGEY